VPGFRSFIEGGTMVDTIEVASTWRHVAPIYHAVTEAVSAVPGVLASTAHTSHAYRSGANLYFTFAVKPAEPADMADAYAECWRRTMQATLRHGGGIAHHHGIGRVRRAWMRDEWGDAGVGLLRALKRALDPDGLLNPGVLLPGAEND
jgi:alkyldihydroxyacetonephosphate synthase